MKFERVSYLYHVFRGRKKDSVSFLRSEAEEKFYRESLYGVKGTIKSGAHYIALFTDRESIELEDAEGSRIIFRSINLAAIGRRIIPGARYIGYDTDNRRFVLLNEDKKIFRRSGKLKKMWVYD